MRQLEIVDISGKDLSEWLAESHMAILQQLLGQEISNLVEDATSVYAYLTVRLRIVGYDGKGELTDNTESYRTVAPRLKETEQ
jgi:hypothetical protein